MQKARRRTESGQARLHLASTACRHTVSGSFHTPFNRELFTFPSRYWFTIGRLQVFRLGRWSSRIQTGFHVSRPTQDTAGHVLAFAYGAVTLYGSAFHQILLAGNFVTPLW